MIRPVLALLAFIAPASLFAQMPPGAEGGNPAPPPLVGSVQGDTYFSPSGVFSVGIPVLPQLGGMVTDTPNVVTFQDSFFTHISIAAFPMDATEKWKLETNGPKDYLKDFFVQYVAHDFFRTFPKAKIDENARFVPSLFGGAFITFISLPGGSMFYNPEYQIAAAAPPVARRGNMLFVKNQYVFVISTELAERTTEGTAYHKTDIEENEVLRDRLIDVSRKIRFLKATDAK